MLGFLKSRREKQFTEDFANAIDVIVRSVKSGLPTGDALRIVAGEFRDPVGGEFKRLTESMKLGVTLEQGLKRMHESMPTMEVGFFATVMTIQQKSGGNLSEALGNLAAVLRDRKRLQGKIKAMSSEAKASAMIIGSLPPGVMGIVYLTTPNYISLLFTEQIGNLLLAGCVVWMSYGHFRHAQDDQFQALRRMMFDIGFLRSALRSALPGDGGRRNSRLCHHSSLWACLCSNATRWANA